MQILSCLPVELQNAKITEHGFLPIAAAYCRSINLVEIINSMAPTQMEIEPGLVVQAMVLDTLSGRTPLYHLEYFLERQDIPLLLGKELDAHAFNDTNLARSMDVLFAAGTSKIITELGIRAADIFNLNLSTTNYDTTSTSVWGEYRNCSLDEPPEGPIITHGHSKDHQPQLKQFMTELLCVDRGVPIFGKTLDGNSSDKTSNNKMLSRISSIMTKHKLGPGAFVYIADSAMVTEANLKEMGSNRFISRLPATYEVCKNAITEAVAANSWHTIGPLTELPSPSSRPAAEYKSYETTVELYGASYRAVVIHSSSHDKRRQKKVTKRVAASAEEIAKKLKKTPKEYFCEADAQMAAKQAEEYSNPLHHVVAIVEPIQVRQRGRPPKDKPIPTSTRYQLSFQVTQRTEGIAKEREEAGCFVMITNVSSVGEGNMDSKGILRSYKGQYGIESDFAFLKDPLIVNDLFLKTPSRIDVLGMILIIALMIWRLMERSMRHYINGHKKQLIGWDNKLTNRPTSYMVTWVFLGIQVIQLDERRFFMKSLSKRQTEFLTALGLGPPVFLDPTHQCIPIIPGHLTQKG